MTTTGAMFTRARIECLKREYLIRRLERAASTAKPEALGEIVGFMSAVMATDDATIDRMYTSATQQDGSNVVKLRAPTLKDAKGGDA